MGAKQGSLQVLSAEKLIEQIASAIDCDDVIEAALNAGAEVSKNLMKNSLQSVLSSEHKNGEMVNALGVSPVKKDYNDNHNIKIGFSEPRSDGKQNAKLASILEHGRSDGIQPARPWLKPIKKRLEVEATEAMSRKFDEEMKKKQ